MSPLRQRMIEDMKLAGLSAATHTIYINAVRGLAAAVQPRALARH
jgi:hypothetical protein